MGRSCPSGSDSVSPDRSTLLTVLRETLQVADDLLDRAALDEKLAPNRVIVSTTYISTPVRNQERKHRQFTGGSKMNADHPAAGGAGPAHKTSRQR